jgi:hypothetical protein
MNTSANPNMEKKDCYKSLLKHGVNPNVTRYERETALYVAIKKIIKLSLSYC